MGNTRTSLNSRTKKIIRAKLDQDHHRCMNPCCNKHERLTLDHIVPLSQGGSDHISNLQLLCRSCNAAKGDRIINYRRMRQRLERQVRYD